MRWIFVESSVDYWLEPSMTAKGEILGWVSPLSLRLLSHRLKRIYSDNYWYCVATALWVSVIFLPKFCIIHLASYKDYMTTTTSFSATIRHSQRRSRGLSRMFSFGDPSSSPGSASSTTNSAAAKGKMESQERVVLMEPITDVTSGESLCTANTGVPPGSSITSSIWAHTWCTALT